MARKRSLTPAERAFLRRLHDFVYGNPFSAPRATVLVEMIPGIPVQDRSRIFERFVRLDPARSRSSGGSGLGLSIVDQIVRSHHGSVAVAGAVPGGAVFILTLPLGQRDSPNGR